MDISHYPGDGSGTIEDPYRITNLFQFKASFNYPGYYIITNGMSYEECCERIDLSSITITSDERHNYTYSENKYKFITVPDDEEHPIIY